MSSPVGRVSWRGANYVRRPKYCGGQLPLRQRRPDAVPSLRPSREKPEWLHDWEQGPGFRDCWVTFTQGFLTRWGLEGCRAARCLSLALPVALALVP